jgi:hypothetical protein
MTFELVLKMAKWMETKLSENRHKGDESGWRSCSVESLLKRLDDEVRELKTKARSRSGQIHSKEVWREAADVANFAMMIADVYEEKQHRRGYSQIMETIDSQ